MAAQEQNASKKEVQKNNMILCANIEKMVELIKEDKHMKGLDTYSSEAAYKDLGITYTSYRRWKNEPDHLIAKRSLIPLYQRYTEKFLPSLSKPADLIDKDITGEMRIISNTNIDFLKLFCNTYNVYYYSAHIPEEIHFGRLRLFTEGERVSAKLVIGIPKSDGLHDVDLCKVFEKDSNSFNEYKTYRRKLTRIEESYCYYYYGTAEISSHMLILTMHGWDRNNHENDHNLKVLINVRRIIKRSLEISDGRPYLAGMSTVISMPNEKHMSLRIFRMGLSLWELPDESLDLFSALLRHNHAANHRIIMSENDDGAWFHIAAKYQPENPAP